jgi:hypothetical protein
MRCGTAPAARAVQAQRRGRARLAHSSGGRRTRRWAMCAQVSKVHAEIVFAGGRFFVRDLHSHAGTALNGEWLPPSANPIGCAGRPDAGTAARNMDTAAAVSAHGGGGGGGGGDGARCSSSECADAAGDRLDSAGIPKADLVRLRPGDRLRIGPVRIRVHEIDCPASAKPTGDADGDADARTAESERDAAEATAEVRPSAPSVARLCGMAVYVCVALRLCGRDSVPSSGSRRRGSALHADTMALLRRAACRAMRAHSMTPLAVRFCRSRRPHGWWRM